MGTSTAIPIRNIYYLLCYAWNSLAAGELIDTSRLPSTDLADLFAAVLCEGIHHLARRGLEQGYQAHEEDIPGIRGRLNLMSSARRLLFVHGRAACEFDELTVNTPSNRILKSTLRVLLRVETLSPELRKRIQKIRTSMTGIDDVILTQQLFRRVQLHSNNRFYRFLLNVCELVHGSWLVDENSGFCRFRDFTRNDRAMAKLFENFLFNFIRLEMPGWHVKRERIYWQAESSTDPNLSLLPRMQTDISLRRGMSYLIVDAKYYQAPFTTFYETEKFHGVNLYQLLTYLSNTKPSAGEHVSGMLVYPRIDRTLRETYTIQGHLISVCTVDLNQDWRDIKDELFGIFA